MKTIHIKNFVPLVKDSNGNDAINTIDLPKLKALIQDLYTHVLKDDPKFHFFFEPEIIIRTMEGDTLERVKNFLTERNIQFEEYDYPFAPKGKFGELRDGIVANNLQLFLTIFHANSVAALTMTDEEHFRFVERLIHTAFNPKFFSLSQEGTYLANLAVMKLGGKEGVVQLMNKY